MEAATVRAQANATNDPETKRRLNLQAQQLEYQAQIETPRQNLFTQFGIAQAGIGDRSATAETAMYRATQVTGSSAGIREAGAQQASIIADNIKQIQTLLDSKLLSPDESRQRHAELINEQRRLEQTVRTTAISAAQNTLSIAGTATQESQISLGQAYARGIGGAAGGRQAIGTYQTAQKEAVAAGAAYRATLAANNNNQDAPAVRAAKIESMQKDSAAQQALLSVGQVPQPLELRQAERKGDFQLDVLTKTYAGWGNIRGVIGGQMANVQEELKNVQKREADAKAQGLLSGPDGKALQAQFDNERMELGEKAIGYQQQLEQGWQDRLISQVANAPSSFGGIASQFTRFEAGQFLQTIGPQFGFTDKAARDYYMHRGPKLANSIIGNVSRPEGFGATAVAMANAGRTGSVTAGVGDGGGGISVGGNYDGGDSIMPPGWHPASGGGGVHSSAGSSSSSSGAMPSSRSDWRWRLSHGLSGTDNAPASHPSGVMTIPGTNYQYSPVGGGAHEHAGIIPYVAPSSRADKYSIDGGASPAHAQTASAMQAGSRDNVIRIDITMHDDKHNQIGHSSTNVPIQHIFNGAITVAMNPSANNSSRTSRNT
jgi:hypothetical protein